MAKKNSTTINIGSPFLAILTLILVLAKLTGHFAFSWWIVFAPVLISAGVSLLVMGIILFVFLLALLFSGRGL